MTPAERLLAAADLLDKRAGEATDGPWEPGERCVWTKDEAFAGDAVISDGCHGHGGARIPADAAYIATMHPEVGKALAKVFRMWAKIVRLDEDLIHRIGGDETLALADLLLAGESHG